MDAVGATTPGTRRGGGRWAPSWFRFGGLGSGHLVSVCALVGLAAYGLLVASVSVRGLPMMRPMALRWVGLAGWLGWMAGYVWSIVAVLRGKRRDRAIRVVALVNLAWSFLLFLVLGEQFAAPPALSFSVMLLCLTGRVRGVGTTVSLIAYFFLALKLIPPADSPGRVLEEFALSALIFYAIPRLVIFAGELEDTRAELAQLAVSEQRLRWARDLHDTLGHGLSVVVLKLDLVERLSIKDPERAARELLEARALLRESIGEMQTVVAGMRDVSLYGEIANASTILNSAGVVTTTNIDEVRLDERVAQTLAWIVREGATNVLRHSDSTACVIGMRVTGGRAVLTMVNDGPPSAPNRAPSGGHGIRGMRERLAALDGSLAARPRPNGGFVLEASVPLPRASVPAPGWMVPARAVVDDGPTTIAATGHQSIQEAQ